MRGHYGSQEHTKCAECGDEFQKKQPHQKFCDILCYEKANRRSKRRKVAV